MKIVSDDQSTQLEDKDESVDKSPNVIPVPDSFDKEEESKSFAIES